MTSLATRKTHLRFETSETIQGRLLIVEATPNTAVIRQKGKRTRYEVSWASIFWLAAKVAADNARREKKARSRRSQPHAD